MSLRYVVALGGLVALTSCITPDYAKEGESPVLLRIVNISTSSGGGGGSSGIGTVLNSDVSVNGSIFNDNATLSVQVIPKNPNVTATSRVTDVILERYEVHYLRTDGRNQEGVDVPFSISGPLNAIVPTSAGTDVPIVIVRHQAKEEPPLLNLRNGGGAIILTTFAEITIHGRTIANQVASATGRVQITFADFADSQ